MNAIVRRRRRELLLGGVLLVLAALLPLVVQGQYSRGLIVLVLLYAGLAQGWNVLGGYCGQISLGHALYFGIGAYTSSMLFTRLGVPPTLGLIPGAGLAAGAALLVGWPCFRLSGHYYAIATLVFGLIAALLVQNSEFVNAAMGITIPFREQSWINLEFRTAVLPFHYAMLAYAALAWVVAYLVEGARWGYYWRAVKDDAEAARSLGVRVFPSKMAAAAISGAITAVGGSLYAQYVGFIDPESTFGLPLSVLIALPAVVGGVGTLWGPLLGAAVLIPVQQLSVAWFGSAGGGIELMIYGALIVVLALARPQGLVSLFGIRAAPVAEPILRICNVSKSFGGVAANVDISFDVAPGEILGLIGPNGAGKSSLFNSICGAVVPDKGEVLLDGMRVSGLSPVACARAGIARTFQVVRSFDSMTVLENVMIGGFLRHSGSRAAMQKALEVLEFCGLGRQVDTAAHSLTPPEKRRLEVARALATEPRILLLDEVLTGLTPTEARAGVQLIRDVRDRGITVVMVEHVMEVLLPLIDRAVVLHLGRKLTEGLPAEIVRNPEVIRAYLGDKFVA